MPGMPPPVADEREGLLAFLQQQRDAVRISAFGLTDDQARTAASVPATRYQTVPFIARPSGCTVRVDALPVRSA